MAVVVVPADPSWPDQFEIERRVLESALMPWLVAGVHHIGSTSVAGLSAKPILDMIAGVSDLATVADATPRLAALGYRSRPHRLDAALFIRGTADADTHHLHLTPPGSRIWTERLTFRDALRGNPDLVAQYTDLKMRLLRDGGGRPYDAPDKRAFVREVLREAGVDLIDGMHSRPRPDHDTG